MMRCVCVCVWCTPRYGESAWVTLYTGVSGVGQQCWSYAFDGHDGRQQCGGFYKEERVRVTGCYITLDSETVLMVRVATNLDEEVDDESFGIDNVVVTRVDRTDVGTDNKFYDRNNFEGWNCGGITTCGNLGQICGGYNVKGKGSELVKKYNLPAGTYSVELDFIKIDSWFVCVM